MCEPASMIVMKEGKTFKVFWSKTSDSHEDIISEYNLRDTNVRSETTLVRVEITPKYRDYSIPLSEWSYKTDQDLLPEWYDAKKAEKAVRKELPKWVKEKIVLPDEIKREVKASERVVAVYGKVQYVHGEAQCVYGEVDFVYGTVSYVNTGGTVKDVRLGGTVQFICLGGTVQYVYGTAECVYGTVEDVYGMVQDVYGEVECVRPGGTAEYVYGKVQYAYGTVNLVCGIVNFAYGTVKHIRSGGMVNYTYGAIQDVRPGGTVQNVCSGGTVITYTKLYAVIYEGGVVVDRSSSEIKCIIGTKKAGE